MMNPVGANVNTSTADDLVFSRTVAGTHLVVGNGCTISQFRYRQFGAQSMSPFVLVDHFHMWEPTFDVHPHAGFSAVTLTFEDTVGEMISVDSLGKSTVFGGGDLHWTTAGRGVLHTQKPKSSAAHIHALQIFVNLPAAMKWIEPDSFRVKARDIPAVTGRGWTVRVVVGEFNGARSPAVVPRPVLMLDGFITRKGESLFVPLAPQWNAWIYVIEGTLVTQDGVVKYGDQAVCAGAGDSEALVRLASLGTSHFVVLAGPRIDEPVFQEGPFVFESASSLSKAFSEFRAGRFGTVLDDETWG
jgi:Pirin-related protein